MKVRIEDRAVFRSLSPITVQAYLLSRGWAEVERWEGRAVVYRGASEKWQALVPLNAELGDYEARMVDVVRAVASAEERSELSVLIDLTTTGADIVRIRAVENAEDGSLPIDAGVKLYQQAREILLSAACTAASPDRPRAVFYSRKPQSATDYIDSLRIGQTEKGSYIITLLSPVAPALDDSGQLSLGPQFDPDPFERKVTKTLIGALVATKAAVAEALDKDSQVEHFEEHLRDGVNANLCEALAHLTEAGGTIDIDVSWAEVRPLFERTAPQHKVRFEAQTSQVLLKAAEFLRTKEPMTGQQLQGWVYGPKRPPKAKLGQASLKVFVDEKPVSVTAVDLDDETYALLAEANKRRLPISCEGDLFPKKSRGYELRNIQNLVMLVPEDT
ncbi:hypothetical protein CU669_11950 [Paramagnetospirillum kuznetsovii]|uniref:Uncharacterized protein n=1 Tax=Paramagnetospirillum kuznetsovii TaxID=2053833 RepID=A0A364NX72_9PROT|nr:hypothetical protein [Paramagnetospirillum kuznetsovii]RAU21684.1 hypothetical protein CU669_11950 [Paramagnetospirillum kuznetsovii]